MMLLKQEKNGFTLAEILMVITIIGMISAMIIPTLISSQEKEITVVRLKEAYSLLSQSIRMSEAHNGSFETWGYLTANSETFAKTYITPYLKIGKVCGTGEQTENKNKCFAGAKGGWYYLNGNIDETGNGYGPYSYYKFMLANGMSIGVLTIPGVMNWAYFAVDIDGPNKGYSKMGRDVFLFSINVNNCKPGARPIGSNLNEPIKNYGFAPGGAIFNCGSNMYQETRDTNLSSSAFGTYACNKTYNAGGTTGAGAACSAVIVKDGWKISDDYPWEEARKKP